jgi:hypothetical protein
MIKAKIYNYDRSDKDPSGWSQDLPSGAHDVFSLLQPPLATKSGQGEQVISEGLASPTRITNDASLDELWGLVDDFDMDAMEDLLGWPTQARE